MNLYWIQKTSKNLPETLVKLVPAAANNCCCAENKNVLFK
jgi:hypothetical protein